MVKSGTTALKRLGGTLEAARNVIAALSVRTRSERSGLAALLTDKGGTQTDSEASRVACVRCFESKGFMRSILMLGADPATVSIYRGHFERAGITVASAEIVKPVLDFIRLAKPSAVLLDITRSDTDGAHLVREIRSQPEFTALPVFALAEKESAGSLSLAAGGDLAGLFWKSSTANVDLVEAVTMALNGTPRPAGRKAGETSPTDLVAPGEGDNLAGGDANPASPPDLPGAIRGVSDAFRVFCATGESKRAESLAILLEQMRGLRRLFLAANQPILTAFVAALVRLTITLSKEGASVSASCLKTLSAGIDILAHALSKEPQLDKVGTAPIRVLVLDDGSDSRRALQYALCSPELALVVRERTDDAIESLRAGNFDVLLADTRMLQDCDFPARLRQLPNGHDIPLILLAAMPVLDARIQAFLNGGCDVIATPYAVSEVVVKAFTFALKRRLGQMVPIHLPDQHNLDADRIGAEPPEPATAKLERVATDSRIPANLPPRDLQRPEPQPQDDLSTRQEHSNTNTNGSANGRGSDLETALNQAKTEGQQSRADSASPLQSGQADQDESPEPETQTLKPQLEPATAERRNLEEQLSQMQNAKPEPASATPPANGSASQGKNDGFQHELDDIAAFDLLTRELNQVRAQLLEERLQRQRIESTQNELKNDNDDLTRKLEAAAQRELAQQQARETLELNVRDSNLKLEKIEATSRSASGEFRHLESKLKDLEARLEHQSSQASIQSIVEESLRRRQAELTAGLTEQRAEVAKTRSALAENQAHLRRTKQNVQAVLSRLIQDLDQEQLPSPQSADTVTPSPEVKPLNGANSAGPTAYPERSLARR
jgi:CheY-like chemotaxis protein